MTFTSDDLEKYQIVELSCGLTVEITRFGNKYFKYFNESGREESALISSIIKLVSQPLPAIGDRVIDNVITSHNLEEHKPNLKILPATSHRGGARSGAGRKPSGKPPKKRKAIRGGARSGAGRKPSGKPPKKRKAIQLDYDIAAKLPNLASLADLLDQFRPIAENGSLRSTKLAEFYKALDNLPYIC